MTVPESEQPDTRWLGPRKFKVQQDFTWHDERKCVDITVPRGFIVDGASIPKIIPSYVVEPEDLSEAAWLLHDYLYRFRGMPPNLAAWATYTRAEVDDLFNRINKRHGVPSRKRKLAYAGVRLGGWAAWR